MTTANNDNSGNQSWKLEDFVDSLVVELDKTRETLAVKAINKPLTYTVKDLAIDLNIFPTFDGDEIRFLTAQPGQQGASKVNIQLGSITDQQVRATTKMGNLKTDTNIDKIDVDKKTKTKLRKLGVTSIDDLHQLETKNVDIQRVSDGDVDYKTLANQIQKSRRNQNPPLVRSVSLAVDDEHGSYVHIRGENFNVNKKYTPVAVINSQLAQVISTGNNELKIKLEKGHMTGRKNELILTLDPYAIVQMTLKL